MTRARTRAIRRRKMYIKNFYDMELEGRKVLNSHLFKLQGLNFGIHGCLLTMIKETFMKDPNSKNLTVQEFLYTCNQYLQTLPWRTINEYLSKILVWNVSQRNKYVSTVTISLDKYFKILPKPILNQAQIDATYDLVEIYNKS